MGEHCSTRSFPMRLCRHDEDGADTPGSQGNQPFDTGTQLTQTSGNLSSVNLACSEVLQTGHQLMISQERPVRPSIDGVGATGGDGSQVGALVPDASNEE